MSLPQPAAARLFVPAQEPHDMVRFGDLRPLADGAPWSVIALIRPQQVTWHGGIICRRSGFQAGRHQFSFWLGDGALALGAGDKVRQSNLRPALNEWSIVAASASPEGCDFYIGGSDGVVTQESLPGLQSGSDNEAEPLRIGNLGDSFPGLIALICLVSGRLHPLTVRSVCAGNISPLGLPNLVFAWQPGLRGDVDLVSRRVPEIRGTRLWTGQEPLPQISAAAPAAAPLRVPADTGFLIAGHSHLFALGALQGYKGGIDMQPVEAGGVRGAFLMEEWRGSRSHDYWSTLVRSGRDRPVFILYNGNQHYGEFMFSSEAFDFLEHDADEPGAAPLVPRKLVQAYFKRTLPELNRILGELRGGGAGEVYVVATPPPKGNLEPLLSMVRGSPYFQALAAQRGVEIGASSFTPPHVMLKLWRTLQNVMRESALAYGARYLPVPAAAVDDEGFLKAEYHADITHANRHYGALMMRAIGGALDSRAA